MATRKPTRPKTRLNRTAAKIDTPANREEYRGRIARRKPLPSVYKGFSKADREWDRYERLAAPKRAPSFVKRAVLNVRRQQRRSGGKGRHASR